MIAVKLILKNGLYKIWNGNDCDGINYYAYLIIIDGQVFKTEWTTNSFVFEFSKIKIDDSEDLFDKFGIKDYQKL